MIFVIGSASQGKTEFVSKTFGIQESDILDAEKTDARTLKQAKAIKHLERLIYHFMKEDKDALSFIKELIEVNPNLIIISNEIGSGLVPIDAFDRAYREAVGRICCQVAKCASQVYRIHCGIGLKIYDVQEHNAQEEKLEESNQIQVYLVRHSMTKGNQEKRFVGCTDESLCEEGIILAKKKKLPSVSKVYVSPLRRCMETADILYPNQDKAIWAGLRETDFGEFEYKNYDDLNGNLDYQKWIDSNATIGFPNGESLEEVDRRVKDTFLQILKESTQNKYKSIAIVTHGGTIMSIMSQFSEEKRPYHEWMTKNCEGFLLEMNGGSICYP